jgi:hypothetical protein
VIGVEDQADVEGPGFLLLRLLAGQHGQEVGGVRQLRVLRDHVQAAAQPMVGGDHRGEPGDQADGLPFVGLRRLVPAVRVVRGGGGDAGPKHRHRRGHLAEGGHQALQERIQVPLLDEPLGDLLQLLPGGEPLVVEEEDGLLEGRVSGQVVDVVADVPELPQLAVDVGER